MYDSPHAPTSPQGDDCMDAKRYPLPLSADLRSCGIVATSHIPANLGRHAVFD
ncbi:hypothetical protein ppKF707_4180 [Metapseudomonas furukawaii]|uniref:Uncharacterized protein n=1 Tax=Metapseudomonas furukawaii TaxID=1149133 RepID=L8MQQ6_METFU|nr:hypothetical protein ppKF707_4589 [Pseudomonas furukawaii]ELS29189.1 hypothetical protein ppKF707_4180 [Pseudomonas furukawaii]BAU73967.1 hypothetical protein KF707C_22790 [Pseudomonas furukawaii]